MNGRKHEGEEEGLLLEYHSLSLFKLPSNNDNHIRSMITITTQ